MNKPGLMKKRMTFRSHTFWLAVAVAVVADSAGEPCGGHGAHDLALHWKVIHCLKKMLLHYLRSRAVGQGLVVPLERLPAHGDVGFENETSIAIAGARLAEFQPMS